MSRVGYLAVSGAAMLWAFGGTFARFLIDRGASLVELTEARAWITLVGVALVVVLRSPRSPVARPPAWVVVVFGLSIAAANYFYYASVARLPVAVAITVQYTAPALVVVGGALWERRAPSGRVIAALVLALGGVALLSDLPGVVRGGRTALDPLGLAAAAASALGFAVYMVSGQRVGRAVGAERAVLRGFAVTSVFWAGVQLARGRPDTLLDPAFIPGIVVLAVFTTLAPFLLFLWGLERIDASRAGITSTLEPLTAAFLAFVWLGQSLGAAQLAGAGLVVVGVAAVQLERPAEPEVLAERAVLE